MSQASTSWFACYTPRPDARLRLIGFPHGGGGPQAFREWGQLLPDDVELMALSLPGRGSRLHDPLITDMAELVPCVVDALPEYFDKPFAFFGHSVGAIVAYEVTRALQQQQAPLPLHLFVSAHKAPHVSAHHTPMSDLPDPELVVLLRELALVPEEALENEALLDLILPPLKADFQLSETYGCDAPMPLTVPVTALGGERDPLVTPVDLQDWASYTTAAFDIEVFDGDHFYTQSHQTEVMQTIVHTLEADVAALPKSLLHGETAPYPDKCLHELFRAQAAQTPDATAVVGDGIELTFAELDAQTDVLARYLQYRGVRVDRLVGIYMETSVAYVIAYLAALKAGGAYMPIEVAYPDALLSRVLNAAQPVVVLTNARFFDRLPAVWQERAFKLDTGWEHQLAAESFDVPDNLPAPTLDSLAYCVMSSGTTGTPKGMICPHRGAVNSYAWRYRYHPYEAGEREASNVFFVWEVIRPLLQGYPSYIIPDDVIYDPPRLVELLSEHRITRVLFTPSLLEQVLNTPNLDLATKLRHLRVVYLNGEVVTRTLRNRFRELFPHVTLLNDYSISECHDVCTYDLAELNPVISPKYAPLGLPMTNVRVYLLDDALQPVPMGFRGEIYVGGDSVARGYLNEPERTAERFILDPIRNDGSRLFRTGDAGRILPNGHLEIQGRIAFMVKLRGYSIVPGAVETTIAEHPAVNVAVVTTLDNEETGQPEHLVAYVVGNGQVDDEILVEQLRPYLKDQLPHYAVPSYLIPLTTLPLTAIGKLDRSQLPKPDLAALRSRSSALVAPPETELEKAISAVWQDLFHTDLVDTTDNFFDLGGHSLLAAELCTRLRNTLDLRVSVVDIFHYPTIRTLAQALHAQVEAAPVRLDVHVPTRPFADTDIAIIGLACRFPGAEDAEQFWSNLREGVCSIRQFSDAELVAQGVPPAVYTQPDYVKAGAVIDGVDQFDPTFWGISRREAIFMDPQHRLFLECCWQALEHAGYAPTQHGARTGVFAGTFLPSYLLHVLHGGGLMDAANPALAHLTEIGNDKDYIATRVSHLLNLRGPSVTVQTSCSTGLVTIATACQALVAGQCDTALAGASSLTFPQSGYQYVDGFVSSRDGQCRAFDADASGTILGDGVGVVVLKRLEDAKAAGDHIMAVIKGFAVNNDGNLKADYSAPSVQGQAEVVAMAQAMAGVDPETITYIEAHGTGTLIGDPIEVRALTTAFQQATTHTGFCGLGSVKPNIGHSNIAAGVAGLIKIVLCMQHRQLPPTINFSTLNPAMELEGTPFYVNDRLREWEAPNGVPRRAGVTSLGIGGTNCHMVVEEWLESAAAAQAAPVSAPMPHLLTVSAKTPAALEQNTRNLIGYLQSHPDLNLADAAYTLHVGREAFPHRLAVACDDRPTAIAQLTRAVKTPSSKRVVPGTRSVVLMFSGQGAQYLGMGKGLYETILAFRQHVETCSASLKPLIEADLCEMLYRVDEHPEVLNRADFLQPALFTVEYAMARTLIDWGLQPKAVVGHSLGEYAAACVAGVVSLEDALGLVVTRGQAMEAAGAGAMLAVSQSEDDMRAFLASREPQVFADGPDAGLAAINAPGRVVLSGSCQAIAQIETELQEADIACQRVHVARAFHSPMMQSAAEAMTRKAETVTLHPPMIPLASNLSGTWLTDEQAQDPAYWSEHMLQPVRFADNVRTLLQQQPDVLLEVGPGRILSSLAGEILQQASELPAPLISPSMRHPREHTTTDAQFLLQMLACLWVAGVDLDWQAFHAGASRQRVPLPSYAFDRQRCWPENGMVQPRLQPSLVPSTHGHLADGQLALADRFYLPSWQRTLPPASEPLHDSARWLVFLDSTGTAGVLGAELVAALEQQGHEVTRVYRDSDEAVPGATDRRTAVINPNRAEDYAALLQQLEQADMAPQRLLYLWALDHANLAVESALRQAYDHLLHLAQALAAHAIQDSCDLWIVTDQTVQVDREAVQPVKATLLGPSTVLPQENPQVSCRVVDVQLPDEPGEVAGLVEHLLHECTAATPDVEPVIALRGEHRWIPRYEALTLEASANGTGKRWLQSHKTYVMTGGLGRIGLELCQYFSQLPSNLVLTTRKAFPDRAQWEGLAASPDVDPALRSTLKQLLQCEAAGATVCVVQADMADADDVQRLCAETIDRFGMISGIFHAAGVADLHYLPDLSPEICAQEFAPKLYGVLHLERAIGQLSHKPEFVVLFSSMAAVLGGVAMTAYTAANRFMDAFVQAHPRRHGVAWLSINWDDWDFAYTKEQIAAYEKTQAAQYAMPPADGIAALERILAYGRPMQLLVTTRPLEARITQWLHQHTAVAGAAHLDVDAVAPMDIDDASALEQRIARVYQEVLGLPSVEAEDNFFDLGGDSLLASQILLQLRRQLPQAVSLQLHAIFDYPTVRDMAKHVAGAEVEA